MPQLHPEVGVPHDARIVELVVEVGMLVVFLYAAFYNLRSEMEDGLVVPDSKGGMAVKNCVREEGEVDSLPHSWSRSVSSMKKVLRERWSHKASYMVESFQENVHLDCGGSAGRDADARRVHGSHAHPHRQVHMSKSIPLFFAVLGSFGTRSLDVDA